MSGEVHKTAEAFSYIGEIRDGREQMCIRDRDCIYLDQVKQDGLNNLTFTGDINGHLVSQHRDEKDWFPYTCLLYTSRCV